MRKRIQLWDKEEYHFPGSGKFTPFLMANLHEDEEIHPAILVMPGGEYTCPDAYNRLLGKEVLEQGIKQHSIEFQVTDDTVPMYIMQGTADMIVPAQNALLLANA